MVCFQKKMGLMRKIGVCDGNAVYIITGTIKFVVHIIIRQCIYDDSLEVINYFFGYRFDTTQKTIIRYEYNTIRSQVIL